MDERTNKVKTCTPKVIGITTIAILRGIFYFVSKLITVLKSRLEQPLSGPDFMATMCTN